MDFLQITAEDVEGAVRDELESIMPPIYLLFPDYKWLTEIENKYYSYFEFCTPKQETETFTQFTTIYSHQMQHLREYYYSLGTSAAGLFLMGKSAMPCIDQIISGLSEQKACENAELLSTRQTIERGLREAKSKLSEEYMPYLLEYVRLTNHEERFFLLGLFVYALEKQLALQKRFIPDFTEDEELIEKLYAPILAESIIVTKVRKDYKGLITA